MKTTIIDGVEVPVVPAKAVEVITNKTTGQTYDSIAEFNADVAILILQQKQKTYDKTYK
jgi:hypothetical protein